MLLSSVSLSLKSTQFLKIIHDENIYYNRACFDITYVISHIAYYDFKKGQNLNKAIELIYHDLYL